MPFIVTAFTSFGTAIGLGTTAAAAFGSFAARLLLSTAISALQSRHDPDAQPRGGLRFSVTQNGGTTPCSFPIGTTAIAGQYCCPPMNHGTVDDTPNAYLTKVIELSDLPGCTLKRVSIDGEWVTPGVTPHPDYGLPVLGRYEDHAWIKFYDGTQGVADPMLLAKYGDYPERPWLPDMVYTGVCYAICTFLHNPEIFRGDPVLKFELGGIPLYDPRKDSTVGGAGSQRWNNVSTWLPSDNPIVQDYNLCRGITFPDGSVWGGKFDADDLPLGNLFAAMNACDQLVSNGSGGTERIYRSGYEVAVTDEPFNVREELLKAANAVPWEVGGTFKVRVGLPAAATIYITDNDLVVSAAGEMRPFLAPQDVFNGITASFPDPDTVYAGKDAPARLNPAWEARDGGRLLTSLSLPAVPYPRQVQRLQKSAINDHQRAITHQFTLLRRFAYIEPGDVLSWTSVENGYIAKLFEVTGVWVPPLSPHPVIAIREIDPSDYDFDADTDILPSSSPSPIKVRPGPQTVPGFAVNGITIKDAAGTNRRPAIEILWFGGAHRGVRAIKYRIRLQASGDIIRRGSTADVDGGRLVIGGGILPGLTYEVSARQVAKWQTVWTDWIEVTTPDIRLGEVDLDAPLVGRISEADRVVAEHDALVAGFEGTLADAMADAAALANAGLEGYLKDPTFRSWTAGNLTAANWASRGGTSAYAVPGGGDFGGGITIDAPATTAEVFVIASSDAGTLSADPAADFLVTTLHLTYGAGDPEGGRFRVEWSNDGTTWTRGECLGVAQQFGTFANLGIGVKPGVRQGFQYLWKRPAGINAKVRLLFYAKHSTSLVATQMVVHLLNLGPATKAQIDAGQAYSVATATPGVTTTVAGIGAAMAQLNSAMTARVGATEASIETVSTALATTDQAVASVHQTLSATANAGTAYFRDTFDGDLSMWEVLSGSGEVSAIDSIHGIGPKLMRLGNNSGNDMVWVAHKHLIPFDPAKLYKMTVQVRRPAGTGNFFAGFLGVAADGETYVAPDGTNVFGSPHWHTTNGLPITGAMTTFAGYTKGRSTPGGSAPGSAANPSEMHSDVRYLRPIILANYNAVAGITELSHVTVDDGAIADVPATVETHAAVISGLTDTAMYSIRVKTAGGESKMELVSSSDPTGPATAINLVSENIVMRASNVLFTSGAVFPDFDMVDDRFWQSTSGASWDFADADAADLGQRYIIINPSVDVEYVVSGWFAVEPSTEYLASAFAWLSTATAGSGTATVSIQRGAVDAVTGIVTALGSTNIKSTTDAIFNAVSSRGAVTITTEATARRARVVISRAAGGTGAARGGGIRLEKKVGAEVVIDGSLTVDKFVAGEIITGDMIVAGAVQRRGFIYKGSTSTAIAVSPSVTQVGNILEWYPAPYTNALNPSNPTVVSVNFSATASTDLTSITVTLQRRVKSPAGAWTAVLSEGLKLLNREMTYTFSFVDIDDSIDINEWLTNNEYRIVLSAGATGVSVQRLYCEFSQTNRNA